MENLRYNRTFKNGLVAILFCIALFGLVVGFFIVSKIQYDDLVSDMKSIEATIIDIDLDMHVRGPDEQEITIAYEVEGVVYNRELKTDTAISFAAGSGAHYSIGDKIRIFYDPQNPDIIASPRSVSVGCFYMAIGLIGLGLVLFAVFVMLKGRRKFLVTQEEYEKDKEQLKKERLEKKKLKKKKRAEAKIIIKIVRVVLKFLLAVFIFLVILGILLKIIG